MGFGHRDGGLFLGGAGFGPFLGALAGTTAARVLLLLFLALVVALAIAIQAKGDGQAEDLGGRPGRQADDDGDNDPDVSPTDEFDLLAGEQGIVMHAGAEQMEAAFATERVIHGERDDGAFGKESVDQQGSDGHGDGIEGPGVMTEEAMKAGPM